MTFGAQLKAGAELAAKDDTIVTYGIRPDHASTRFGYLQAGEALSHSTAECPFYHAEKFVEKPDAATAEKYLATKKFFWNAGIFLWKTSTFLREAKRLKPELAEFVENFPKKDFLPYIAEKFPALPKISVDYAIMEKASKGHRRRGAVRLGRHGKLDGAAGPPAHRRARQLAARCGNDARLEEQHRAVTRAVDRAVRRE